MNRIMTPIETLEQRLLFAVGSVDPTFGVNGLATVQFTGGAALTQVRDSIAQADGKILVAGRAADTSGATGATDFAVARLNADGTPDTTFGVGGVVVIHSDDNTDSAESVALAGGGKIVVAGYFSQVTTGPGADQSQFIVARLNADGSGDTSFGNAGVITQTFGAGNATPNDEAHFVQVLPDGTILAVGTASSETAMSRYNADGSLDTAFGNAGIVVSQLSGGPEQALSATIEPNGQILTVGTAGNGAAPSPTFLAERFNNDGSVDTRFGKGGATVVTFDASNAATNNAAIQPDGRIVLGGYVVTGNLQSTNPADVIYNFGLARLKSNGVLDKHFGSHGIVVGSPQHLQSGFNGYEVINRVLLEPGGGLIVSGTHAAGTAQAYAGNLDSTVAGYETNGKPDTGFGSNGQMILGNFPTGVSEGRSIAVATPADEAAEFRTVAKKQAAIVMALSDRLLVISSAAGQVTAARLIGDGPDLQIDALSGINASSVLGGAKSVVILPLSNDGSSTFNDSVNIALLLSTDQTPDSGDANISTFAQRVNLKADAHKNVKAKFTFPTDLSDGSYFVLAQIQTATGAETDPFNNQAADPTPIMLSKPFIDIAATFASPDGTTSLLVPGKTAKLDLLLTNDGNIAAKGTIGVSVVASTDQISDATDISLPVSKPLSVSLKPQANQSAKLKVAIPADMAAGNYFLIAHVDPAALLDTNPLNDTAIATMPVVVL